MENRQKYFCCICLPQEGTAKAGLFLSERKITGYADDAGEGKNKAFCNHGYDSVRTEISMLRLLKGRTGEIL